MWPFIFCLLCPCLCLMYGLCIYLTACLVLLLLLFAAAAAVLLLFYSCELKAFGLFHLAILWAEYHSHWRRFFGCFLFSVNPMSRISLKLEKMLWVLSHFNVEVLCGSWSGRCRLGRRASIKWSLVCFIALSRGHVLKRGELPIEGQSLAFERHITANDRKYHSTKINKHEVGNWVNVASRVGKNKAKKIEMVVL